MNERSQVSTPNMFCWTVCAVLNLFVAAVCWRGVNVTMTQCVVALGVVQLLLIACTYWLVRQLSLQMMFPLVLVCCLMLVFAVPGVKRGTDTRNAAAAIRAAGGEILVSSDRRFPVSTLPRRYWPIKIYSISIKDKSADQCVQILRLLGKEVKPSSVSINGDHCSDEILFEIAKNPNVNSLTIQTNKGPTNLGIQRVTNSCQMIGSLKLGVKNPRNSPHRWTDVNDDAFLGVGRIGRMTLGGISSVDGSMFRSVVRPSYLCGGSLRD